MTDKLNVPVRLDLKRARAQVPPLGRSRTKLRGMGASAMRIGRFLTVALASAALVLGGSLVIGPGTDGSSALSTAAAAPIPAVPGQLRVTAAGDYSATAEADGVLTRVGAIKPDLHLALGDLSYGATGAEQAWCDFVTSRTGPGFPFQLVSGNHESNGLNGNINDFAACLPNQLPGVIGTYGRQYYVDVPEENPLVRFVFISPGMPFSDGVWDYSAGSARYNWTAAAIDGARAASVPWVVVGMHAPCISVGIYDCVAGPALTNLLLSKKVDLVLNGHEHHYQRSKQLATAAGCTGLQPNAYNPSCVRDPDNALDKGAGSVFATVGTGGRPLRNVNAVDAEAPYFAAYSGLNSNPSHGLLDLQFTSTSMNAAFVATNGTYTDAFSIAPAGSNPPTTSFTASPTSGTVPLTVNFTDTSTGSPTSWAWDFGDGGTATTQNPSHTYSTAGTYTARLTATNAAGSTSSTRTITVNPPGGPAAPVASFTAAPTSGTVPLTVNFTDTSTGSPTSWAWDFGNGATSTTQNPSHTYATAGTYTARLTATNSGGSTSATATITVNPAPPASGITARSSSTANTSTATTTVALAAPAGRTAGDVLVASFTADQNPTVAVPAGWTAIVNGLSIASSSTAGARVFAYYRVVGSSDPATYTWALSRAVKWGGGITAYTGVNTTTPLDSAVATAVNTSYTATSIAVGSVTTASNGAMLIGGLGFDSSNPAATPPTGWTERWEATGGQIAEQADRTQATAGATGTATWTFSSAKAVGAWRTALKPAG
ncbi:PKD domain-containing protein [Arthrobacter pascens]|uniref:PKD domain-containing protein n=1 Tax=Arthrobacter pascens TaxID=1677 RepID=UPI00196AD5A9|nr:PKD domain-containing protein [Arthrobacter pascens]MBN3498319.1 PKD domain-containing protein [Arthrobacter pascens]